jgi:hypothetical protein
MVNPIYRNTGSTPQNAAPALDRNLDTLSSPRTNTINSSHIDDVIGSLANAYENERARQVVEWERLWRQAVYDNGRRAAL